MLKGVAVNSEKVQPLPIVILRLGPHGRFPFFDRLLCLITREEGTPYPAEEDMLRLGEQADQLVRCVAPFQNFGIVLGGRRGDQYFEEPVCTESPAKPMAMFQFEWLKGQVVQGPVLLVVVAGFYDQGHGVPMMLKRGKRCLPRCAITSGRQGLASKVGVCLESLIELGRVAPGIIIRHIQCIEPHSAMEGRSGDFPEDWERSPSQGFRASR